MQLRIVGDDIFTFSRRRQRQCRLTRIVGGGRFQQQFAAADSMNTQAEDPAADATAKDPFGDGDAQQPRQRRSRDRYGRDRRNGGRERAAADSAIEAVEPQEPADAVAAPSASAAIEPSATASAEQPARRSYFDAVQNSPADQADQAQAATETEAPDLGAHSTAAAPMANAETANAVDAPSTAQQAFAGSDAALGDQGQQPQAVVASAAVAETAAADAVVTGSANPPAARTAYSLPLGDLQQLAAASGLQWVNSDPDKVAAVQAAIAAEPQPIHVPRERPPVVVLDEGPLVLVETRRDLAAVKLPFDA